MTTANPDVFISYGHEDRSWVELLVACLENEGWSVWWDHTILPGDRFQAEIQSALARARGVVVVWSESSVDSDWVVGEATVARKREVLVPARIDTSEPPIQFNAIQSADLREWRGDFDDPEVRKLVAALRTLVEKPQTLGDPAALVGGPAADTSGRKPVNRQGDPGLYAPARRKLQSPTHTAVALAYLLLAILCAMLAFTVANEIGGRQRNLAFFLNAVAQAKAEGRATARLENEVEYWKSTHWAGQRRDKGHPSVRDKLNIFHWPIAAMPTNHAVVLGIACTGVLGAIVASAYFRRRTHWTNIASGGLTGLVLSIGFLLVREVLGLKWEDGYPPNLLYYLMGPALLLGGLAEFFVLRTTGVPSRSRS